MNSEPVNAYDIKILSPFKAYGDKCDFCKSGNLEFVYDVHDSVLGVKVAICDDCGLIQSIPARKREVRKSVSTSSGATRYKIHVGKKLRLNASLKVINDYVSFKKMRNVLDIGSSRGDFVSWVSKVAPSVNVAAIEPDSSVADYSTLPNLTLYVNDFEDVKLSDDHFGFVYCFHTLEHAHSASVMLDKIRDVMKPGGYLFIEVPNIETLTASDIVEEFFIDMHKFHFNRNLLCDYLKYLGYNIIYVNNDDDIFYITLLLRKNDKRGEQLPFLKNNDYVVSNYRKLIKEYRHRLHSNRNKLKDITNRIRKLMAEQKVAFWGAGRLFDALVRYGGLETGNICCLIDTFLQKITPVVYGVEVKKPEFVKKAQPDMVIVLSRDSYEEIADIAFKLGIRNIIGFTELLKS